MQRSVKVLIDKIGFPVISQTACSLTNFTFNMIGIAVFSEDFSLWFIMSFINVFIQSINRSAFLELLLLKSKQELSALWKCHFLAVSVNILAALYLILSSDISNATVFAMCMMFCVYQSQDILRYIFLNEFPGIVTISDFLILLLLMIQFFANLNVNLTSWNFILWSSATFILGFLVLLFQFRNFSLETNKVKTGNPVELSLFVSNFCVFFFSILIITILHSSLSNAEMIDYRIIVLLLSPIGALIRLDWIKQITEYVGEETRASLIRRGFKLLGIFSIFLQIELLSLWTISPSNFSYSNVICLTLGIFTMAINVWNYPLLIKLLSSGNFMEILMIICGNTVAVSIYCLLYKSSLNLILIFSLSLGAFILQSFYLFGKFSKEITDNTKKENF